MRDDGHIQPFNEMTDAQKATAIPIPDKDLARVTRMTMDERMTWRKREKRKAKRKASRAARRKNR